MERQTTICRTIDCKGVGLHGGERVKAVLRPAPAGAGIVFRRMDLDGAEVPARYDRVADTGFATTLEGANGVRVRTVEHLMAALWGCGVDNLYVDLDGSEVPAMDGSAEPFVFLVECVGLRTLDVPRETIRVLRPVEVCEDGARIALLPDAGAILRFEIAFDHPAIGAQTREFAPVNGAFRREIAHARTFCLESQISALRARGLAKGGSLENAVVVGDRGVLNDGGLRFDDEFVRHKVLDCLGDLYLAGGRIVAQIGRAHV